MRAILVGIAVGWMFAPLRADMPELLKEAGHKVSEDTDRWAYTETTVVTDNKGRARGETVVQVDPSKPYAEQFTPLKINGKKPTESQLKQYRRRGERKAEERSKTERTQAEAVPGAAPRVTINGAETAVDLDHIAVVEEDANRITYDLPLRGARPGVSMENFQLLLRVNKPARTLESASLRVRAPFRTKLVVKVNRGAFDLDFVSVDPQYAPPLTAMRGDLAVSLLFVKVAEKVELKRTEFRRVKPYDEHFLVKLGPLQFLSF